MAATLSTVIVMTRRMDAIATFYAEGLGLGEPARPHPGHVGWSLGAVYFGIDAADRDGGGGGVSAWFDVDDLQATFDRLVGLGAKVHSAPARKPWGGVLAAVEDPDGNLVGLAQRA